MGYEHDHKDEQENVLVGGTGQKKAIVANTGQKTAIFSGIGQKMAIFVGPYGGLGGTPWDDGSHDGVILITLTYGSCINSMQTLYIDNVTPVLSEMHGVPGGQHGAAVELQYPDEYLISVKGHYGPLSIGGPVVVRSLTFTSNRKTHGPFGKEEGTPFLIEKKGWKTVGFRGRSSQYMESIGCHLKEY